MARSRVTDRGDFQQFILTDQNNPDQFTVHTREKLDGVLEHCKNVRENRNQKYAEAMRPVAEIPMTVYMQALEQAETPNGVSPEEYCKRWAMKPENALFRLSTGSV